jgi:glycosyltransferase involved in cell wall biosynthesis
VIQDTADSPHDMRSRGLTDSQIARRVKGNLITDKHVEVDSNIILKFGNKSNVSRTMNGVNFFVHDEDLCTLESTDFTKTLNVARGPMPKFIESLNKGGTAPKISPIRPAPHKMLHIGIWMNNVNHYSGGRVHLLLMAYSLAEMGHKVTIVTDQLPRFLGDLRYYDVGDRIEYIYGDDRLTTNWLTKATANNMNIVIATPRIYEAFYYAKKWNLPCYAFLLETPNFVSQYRGGQDSTELYWEDYKKSILSDATFVMCNPGPTIEAAKEWLSDFRGEFFECPPAINVRAADRAACEEENEVCFVGRHLDFKKPDDVVLAVGKLPENIRPSINFIGSHNDQVRERLLNKARPMGVQIKFYAGLDDYNKFALIKRSKALLAPSEFEGFGMVLAEALYCEKPVIAYDIPIIRHVYGDSVNLVPKRDLKGVVDTLRVLLENPEKRLLQGLKGKLDMYSPTSNIPCLPFKVKNNLRNIFYGKYATENSKITAGIIVLNGEDTLEKCLKSIYEHVEHIIIVEGVVEDYAKQNPTLHANGRSVDKTIEIVENFYDPLGKIELVMEDKIWKNKNEMQNEIAKRVKTGLYLKVDADEIWAEKDIEYCRRIFIQDAALTVMYMQRWHFWKSLKMVAVGGQWDCAEARMWRWTEGFHHTMEDKKGFNYLVDAEGKAVRSPTYKTIQLMQRLHFHLGYCRNEEHIRGKIRYYANRGIEHGVEDNYTNWKDGQPTNSTHPEHTTAIPFRGELPIVLREGFFDIVETDPKQVTQNNLGMLNASPKEER